MSKEKNKYGLTERSIRELYAIFSKYPDVKEVHLFGSRAKGNYKTGSDIDLAVMNTGLQPKTISRVLAECAESSLPVAVDLVDFNALTYPAFIDHIQRTGILFYAAKSEHTDTKTGKLSFTDTSEKGLESHITQHLCLVNGFEERHQIPHDSLTHRYQPLLHQYIQVAITSHRI